MTEKKDKTLFIYYLKLYQIWRAIWPQNNIMELKQFSIVFKFFKSTQNMVAKHINRPQSLFLRELRPKSAI